jgi:TRAP-type C4-dicarboxylate transport system permease small subunit
VLTALDKAGRFLEDAILVAILAAMIALAFSQIILRNFFDIGVIWSDELLRLMVLWLAVSGAVAASRTDKHINIAILDRLLPERAARWSRLAIQVFTAFVCAVVAWYGALFVLTSREFGDELLGGVPAWWLQAPLPLGFALMAWRYAVHAVTGIAGRPDKVRT